jgi:hypothetical protein
MSMPLFDSDYHKADALVFTYFQGVRDQIAKAIAKERERCASIALAIDSGRGNEKEIARAIRSEHSELPPIGDSRPPK